MWNLFKYFQQQKLRKYYTKLRLDALEAHKNGDIKRSLALNAMADKLMSDVIYS
ncbi:MAG: hypothetical protein J7604_17460 [Sporocytophaga sp.]|uniref:DUF6435 family protein n=1 Tax=Sporocytophaga sp. TaxID=2231183 RepID=UPI001B0107BA|nr:DUF6435 family protein [Sporocytophaga sp.]MBO9701999.1 hypothetical protein [Sporocytophaga sp.]